MKALNQLKKHLKSVLLNREPYDAHSSLVVFWGLCATWLYILLELSIKSSSLNDSRSGAMLDSQNSQVTYSYDDKFGSVLKGSLSIPKFPLALPPDSQTMLRI